MTTLSDHIRHEHREIEPHVDSILTTAHAVGVVPRQVLVDLVTGVMDFLRHELLPHALKEDEAIYQAVEKAIGAKGSTDTMKREHEGIKSYVDELTDLQGVLMSRSEIHEDTVRELRRVLYGIHALVEMHLTVEEDVYLPLLDTLPSEAQQHYIDEVERVLED